MGFSESPFFHWNRRQLTTFLLYIAPIVSRDPEAASKFVNELYLTNIKNSYSVFRLGEERFKVVPSNVQVEGILS